MPRAVIALGSNLGLREEALSLATAAIAHLPGTTLLATAKRYETAPVDVPPRFARLTFLNSALLVETSLAPEALLGHLLRIEAEDDSGNRSSLEFPIAGRAESFRAVPDPTATALFPGENTVVGVGPEARIRIQPGSLYEPLFVRPERLDMPQGSPGVVVLSPAYRFLEATTPLREPALVTIRAQVPRQLRLRTVLAGRSRKGGLYHVGGTYSNGAVTAVTRTTGDLVVVADTLAPTIRPLFTEGVDLTKATALRFHVGDNFSGITTWTLRIDGEWVPCDRFPMKGTLVHTFDTPATRRRHTAELTVRDGCGNAAHYKGSFIR